MSTPIKISTLSTEPIRVPVFAYANGIPLNLVGMPVDMAFVTPGQQPAGLDWAVSTWDVAGGVTKAEGLVSQLSVGTYDIWLRVNNVVVKKVGVLMVY